MIAYIALGSNLGDRLKNIAEGMARLAKLGQTTPSPLIMECGDESGMGPPYLNTAARLDNHLVCPRALLEECLRIEIACGRDRSLPPNSPRTLDIDLISVDGWSGSWEWTAPKGLEIVSPRLTLILPHPRAGLRDFVIKPLEALGETIPASRQPLRD